MAQPQASLQSADFGAAEGHDSKNFWALALGSVGVVFGDIGTSPLYAFKEAIAAASHRGTVAEATLGVLSLIFWSMTLVVTVKYVLLLLRADNKGEGGMFALMALGQSVARRSAPLLGVFGIAGACFFYGDAVITPAISVLSAVEGLRLVAPQFEVAVIPAALVVLTGLFWMQSHGTERVARFFGPIMALWFAVLAIGGLMHIADNLHVLFALNPYYGIEFVYQHGVLGLTVMGLVFLACTGAEALYADLGHFGRKPITVSWLYFVMPSLVLNYFGQGALVMNDANAIENPFYRLYPEFALIPMLILSTFATVIASQAVITGAFSLTRQAIQLGLIPRFEIRHTSESIAGQIYMPRVNWLLFVFVVMVIFAFRTSSNLAAAYGVSVTAAMVIDTLMAFFVIWQCWKWPLWRVVLIVVPLLLIEQAFFSANILKLLEGGWVPLVIAAMLGIIMFTWVRGSHLLVRLTKRNEADLDWLVRKLEAKPPHRGKSARRPARTHHRRACVGQFPADHRALWLYGNAERAEDPGARAPQGLQHRHRRNVVLPVAPLPADDAQVGASTLAGAPVHRARGKRRGCDDLFPDSDRSGRRGWDPGRHLDQGRLKPPVSTMAISSARCVGLPYGLKVKALNDLKPGNS
jgi:KUP system potassium uptake protein